MMMLSSDRAFDDFLDNLSPFVAQLAWEKFEATAAQSRRDEYDAETDALLQRIRTVDPKRRHVLNPAETMSAIEAQWRDEYKFRETRRAS